MFKVPNSGDTEKRTVKFDTTEMAGFTFLLSVFYASIVYICASVGITASVAFKITASACLYFCSKNVLHMFIGMGKVSCSL